MVKKTDSIETKLAHIEMKKAFLNQKRGLP